MRRVRRLWAALVAVPVLILSVALAGPALADTWSPPPGAVDLLFWGGPTSGVSPFSPVVGDATPTQSGGLTSVAGLSIGRIPGVGTWTLSSKPLAGQVYADPQGTCGSPTYVASGTIDVHEVSYADDGTLQQIAAEVSRTCGQTTKMVWRWRSAFPFPRLTVTPPPAAIGDVGDVPWRGDWTVRNTGTGPATLNGLSSPPAGGSWEGTCASGVVLQADETCTMTLVYDTRAAHTTKPPVGGGVSGVNVPAVFAIGALTLPEDLVPPTLRVEGRTTTDVSLSWSPGQTPQDDPVAGYELVKTVNGLTTSVPLTSPLARSWQGDPQRTSGYSTGWSVRLITSSGRRSVLSTISFADTAIVAMLGPSGDTLVGGSSASDASAVRLVPAGDLPAGTSVVGVDTSPDHKHALLTVHDSGGADALWVTDLRGANRQVVDTSGVPPAAFHRAVLSSDGRRAALTTAGGAISVVDLSAAPGHTVVLAATGEVQAWAPNGTNLLVLGGSLANGQPAPPGLRWVVTATGASTPLPGTAAATGADVNRLGDVTWRQPGQAGSEQLQVLAAGATAPKVLWNPTGCSLGVPAYDITGDGLALAASGDGCSAISGPARTVRLNLRGSDALSYASPTLPIALDGPIAFARSAAAPPTLNLQARDATPLDGLPALTRSTVTIAPDVADADDPIQALTGSCSVDDGTPAPCPVTDFPSPVLGQGNHTLTMTVTDPAGNHSGPVTVSWTVDSTAPTVTMSALPTVLAASSGGPYQGFSRDISWSGRDNAGGSGVVSYDARYRFAYPTSRWSVQLGAATNNPQPSMPWAFQQGSSYCFSARARDAAGNIGPWSAERCTSVVLDDGTFTTGTSRSMTPYRFGPGNTYGEVTFMDQGDYRQSSAVSAGRVGVVVTACPTCGSLEVWQGSRRLGVVSGWAAATTYRTVRWLPALPSPVWGAIKVVGVTRGKVVAFDGVVLGK